MHFRIVLLFLVASLLGTPVLLHHAGRANVCARIADPALCATAYPDPLWVRPLGILSLLMLGYALYVLATAWAERRHEKQMLDTIGVHVREEDLPLEE